MKNLLILAALLALAALPARAEKLTLQLNGPALAESAGYVVAQARGYYADEGLEVTLQRAGDAIPLEALARGQADLAVETLPVALAARESGLPLVNIGQPFARPALRLTCLNEAGVASAADLRGKTLGSSFGGTELALRAWLNRLGLRADDSLAGVAILHQWPDASEMLRQRQTACIAAMAYAPPQTDGTITLDPALQGAELLEDGLYVLHERLNDAATRDRLARFLRASMKGWHEATRTPEATAALILGPDPDQGALQRQTQALRALADILSTSGALDDAAYRRSVDNLLAGGPAAVLRAEPQGAFTHAISDMASAVTGDMADNAANAASSPRSPATAP